MNPSSEHRRILEDPEFRSLVRTRDRLSIALTIVMLVVYFGFIALVAWGRAIIGADVGRGVTAGIPIGIGVILFSIILTALYVRWANVRFDAMVDRVRRDLGEGHGR